MDEAQSFAEGQFGHAELGDPRRTRRLVKVTSDVIKHQSPIVSRACGTSASREGAFRLLENSAVHVEDIAEAIFVKTQQSCRGQGVVIVPIDASAITIKDGASKGLGAVARWTNGARGFHAMTALAVATDGTPIGICAQELWTRTQPSTENQKGRAGAGGEGRFWLNAVQAVVDRFAEIDARPWLQMDRGADCWRVLALVTELDTLATIRASHDRRLETGGRLWATLQRAEIGADTTLDLRARPPRARIKKVDGKVVNYFTPPRRARTAKVVVRAKQVTLRCTVSSSRELLVPINAVFVCEPGRPKDDRIEWMLLTTHPIETREDILEIVRGYALRWRIEDFHRAWKSGLCGVEDTELRSRDAIFKWSTILAAVATRAMRLTHLARETPDALASTEFTNYELEAILVQRKPKGFNNTHFAVITLGQAVRWIADTAGYNGPWKGPPGVTIVGRGLERVEIIAHAFEQRDNGKM